MTVELAKSENRVPTVKTVEEGIHDWQEADASTINRVFRAQMRAHRLVPRLLRAFETEREKNRVFTAIARVDTGQVISNWYDEILLLSYRYLFQGQEKVGKKEILVGRIATSNFPLILKIDNVGEMVAMARCGFYELRFRDDLGGLLTGLQRQSSFIINPLTGEIISSGYIELFESGGVIYGQTLKGIEAIMPVPQLASVDTI